MEDQDKDSTEPTLEDLGINKNQSSRWQKEATVTEENSVQIISPSSLR